MTREQIITQIFKKSSVLCVGLDTVMERLPEGIDKTPEGMLAFNKGIIDATNDLCVAYKLNSAFYEAYGTAGWSVLEETIHYIPDHCLKILDAKRGDIGNTSKMYARAAFDTLQADAVTIAPYMGEDSVRPFIENRDTGWVILLALTSNPGSQDFELQDLASGQKLYEQVIQASTSWASPDRLMYVLGATRLDYLKKVREAAPDYFFLVPGVGAQGGDLQAVLKNCWIPDQGGLIINSSRGIIYKSSGADFAEAARGAAEEMQAAMAEFMSMC